MGTASSLSIGSFSPQTERLCGPGVGSCFRPPDGNHLFGPSVGSCPQGMETACGPGAENCSRPIAATTSVRGVGNCSRPHCTASARGVGNSARMASISEPGADSCARPEGVVVSIENCFPPRPQHWGRTADCGPKCTHEVS